MTGAAPKITKQDIENQIANEHYFTARQGAFAGDQDSGKTNTYHSRLGLLTFCVLEMKNGFIVTGESSCVSAENFDAEKGKEIARDEAINKIWGYMGFELPSKLSGQYAPLVTDEMVNRFLQWKLPKDFQPDAGISFNPGKPYEGDEHGNSWWPVGTNLLHAGQAKDMLNFVVANEVQASE